MKKFLFPIFLLIPLATLARETSVASPNGKLVVTINDEGGQLHYAVSMEGRTVLSNSNLGFKADFGNFTQRVGIVETKAETQDYSYNLRQAKQSSVHVVSTLLNVDVENEYHQKMTVQFHVADNDIAFRYLIPRQKKDNPKSAVIRYETSGFNLPAQTRSFLSPQCNPMTGWERTKPSYEEEYQPDVPLTAPSQYGRGYTFPCLFRIPDAENGAPDLWVLISETGVSGQYCGSRLSEYDASKGFTITFPMEEENNGIGSSAPGLALPGATPWRTITVGTSLKPIVETTIPYDVVEPLYEASEDYRYGRYTWSWLIWQDNSVCWEDQIAFIDLAADMGYEYCLVDGFWDTQIGRDRMPELARYAQSKGVSLLLWYNSNGFENDAPQTPRQRMNTAIARDQEMAWLKRIGVKGIKVDFFGGDKQATMQLYEDILYDANRYGIQCIFHGCTLPRGWERMFPNYISSEAVLASENVYFTKHHAEQEPFQLTMHPFCRNAVGTMDWGGIIMNKYMSRDNKSRHQRQTTDVFEMASGITNQAAIQCVAIQPNNLSELPAEELDFLKQLPTTWDETRFIDGYPGKYVVLARRHGEKWFVAGLNAMKEPLTLTLDLSDFSPTTLFTDHADKKGHIDGVTKKALKTNRKGLAKVTIQPNGGCIIY